MVRRGRPPSGRIRRGLGTRVLLTCPGPADPRYWGGSSRWAPTRVPLRYLVAGLLALASAPRPAAVGRRRLRHLTVWYGTVGTLWTAQMGLDKAQIATAICACEAAADIKLCQQHRIITSIVQGIAPHTPAESRALTRSSVCKTAARQRDIERLITKHLRNGSRAVSLGCVASSCRPGPATRLAAARACRRHAVEPLCRAAAASGCRPGPATRAAELPRGHGPVPRPAGGRGGAAAAQADDPTPGRGG